MSISTLIIGSIDFKERPPEAVIHEITSLLELPEVKYVDDFPKGWENEASYSYYINNSNRWSFLDLNWSSHVDGDKLQALDKYKSYFLSCFVDWFYLDEADERYKYDEEEEEILVGGVSFDKVPPT